MNCQGISLSPLSWGGRGPLVVCAPSCLAADAVLGLPSWHPRGPAEPAFPPRRRGWVLGPSSRRGAPGRSCVALANPDGKSCGVTLPACSSLEASHRVYSLARAAITEHHRLGGLNNRNFLPAVPAASGPRGRRGQGGFFWGISLWLADGRLLPVSSRSLLSGCASVSQSL